MGNTRRLKHTTKAPRRTRRSYSPEQQTPAPTTSRYVVVPAEKSGAKPEPGVVVFEGDRPIFDHTSIFKFWKPDPPPYESALGPVKKSGRRGRPPLPQEESEKEVQEMRELHAQGRNLQQITDTMNALHNKTFSADRYRKLANRNGLQLSPRKSTK